MQIDLNSELSFRNCFRYPLQNKLARRELALGAVLVLVPLIGWLLNMGHRIQMVHNMQTGREAWPAWRDYSHLLRSGTVTFLGMIYYYLPGSIALLLARHFSSGGLYLVATLLLLAATIAIPGYMTHYCRNFNAAEIFSPFRALRRVFEGGPAYWKAWAIALSALIFSFFGLLLAGIGFLFTSVWFWQVAGFSFACVFSHKFRLLDAAADGGDSVVNPPIAPR